MDSYAYYAVCFGIFGFLFYRPIIRSFFGFLDEKITTIKWEVESSIHAKEALEKELREYKKDLPFVERKHKSMIESAEKEIGEAFKARCADLKENLKFSEKNALARIEQMEKEAVSKVKSEILQKSLQIVSSYFADQNNSDLDLAIVSTSLQRQ